MKRLSIFVVLAAVVLSCNNTGSEPEETIQYPIITGTWKINSPNDAEWIGKQSKAKISVMQSNRDTIYLNKPGEGMLRVWKDTFDPPEHRGQVFLSFVDSSVVIDLPKYDSTNAEHRAQYEIALYGPPWPTPRIYYAYLWSLVTSDFDSLTTGQRSYRIADCGDYADMGNCIETEIKKGIFAINLPLTTYECGEFPNPPANQTIDIYLNYVYDPWYYPIPYFLGESGFDMVHTRYVIPVDSIMDVVEHLECSSL